MSKIQNNLLKRSSCNSDYKPPIPIYSTFIQEINKEDEVCNLDLDKIYEEFEKSYKGFEPWAEEVLCKWSEKTNILTSNLSKTGLKQLLHTPIGQVQRMMETFERLQVKTQLKRGHFRIIGEGLENLERDFDEEIYDDSDLMQEMMKSVVENNLNESGGFPGTEIPLFETTQQYLLERRLKNEEKKQKNVDRRASKNRKIRYDIHAKLINFMQSNEKNGIIEGRDEILKTIKKRFFEEVDEEIEKEEKNDEPKIL